MLTHKRLLIVVVASVLLLALGVVLGRGGAALAMPTAQGVAPTGATIPYSGRLLDASGQAMPDSAYDFNFSLYDAADGGTVLWSETQYGLTVNGGALTTSLGKVTAIPKEVSERKELWLAVSVRGPGETEFTLLNPRQSFNAGPATIPPLTCPHSHFNDNWYSPAGATNYGLIVDNSGSTGDGIRAYSASTVTNYAAIYAVNEAGTGYGTGVYGSSNKGLGVYAYSGTGDGLEATTGSTTGKSAVYAHSTTGNGVWAVSGSRVGVEGISTSSYGVAGFNNHDTTTQGNYGGYFTSNNYRGAFLGTLNLAWYGAAINGGLIMTNGGCTGCTLIYVGMNNGDDAIRPGDLVAIAGVETDAATSQPMMLVRLASNASDPVIGVVVGGASAPDSQTGPDKIQTSTIMRGEYMQIAVSGLVQARVANKSVAIGDRLSPGSAGAIAAADVSNSVARVMSEPDENGLAWVLVNGR